MLVTVALLGVAPAAQSSRPSSRPLPDPDTFVAAVRERLQLDDAQQRGYSFVETRRETRLDGNGQATDESVKVFESYPGLPGQGRWERLISEDGQPVSAEALAEAARKRDEETRKFVERRARQTEADRAKQAQEQAEQREELNAMLEDAFRVFEFEMTGRERIGGHETVSFTFTPRRDVKTETRMGGMLHHFQGRAWVSESDYELVRLEAEALEDVTIGFGLLARIHEGTHFTMERQLVNGEDWLPARTSYTASVRILLIRRTRVRNTSEFSDYRQVSDSQQASVEPVAP